jgi:GNAT superfamily N-acetyltransferase
MTDRPKVRIRVAGPDDLPTLAHLLWLHAVPDEQATQSPDSFAEEVIDWWGPHQSTHTGFLARSGDATDVGMAWSALLPRTPRPGSVERCSADIQSVFVLPEYRGEGIGSALVRAAAEHAERAGAARVTVHSGRRAVPVYERLGFTSSPQLMERMRQ